MRSDGYERATGAGNVGDAQAEAQQVRRPGRIHLVPPRRLQDAIGQRVVTLIRGVTVEPELKMADQVGPEDVGITEGRIPGSIGNNGGYRRNSAWSGTETIVIGNAAEQVVTVADLMIDA